MSKNQWSRAMRRWSRRNWSPADHAGQSQDTWCVGIASLINGRPRYVGTVELGIRNDLPRRLEGLRIGSPAVPCSAPAKWVRPEVFCTVRFCGWRPNGVWRDAELRGLPCFE
jgi:hypothetical protein